MGIHIGYGGATKKVKAIYAGVGGAVKKVKAVYGGVSNAVRLLWRSEVLNRQSAPPLAQAKSRAASALAGQYAVVLGGDLQGEESGTNTAEAYTADLVHKTDVASVELTVTDANAVSAGNHAIFQGGKRDHYSNFASNAFWHRTCAYDNNLVQNTGLSNYGGNAYVATTKFNSYGVFAGGQRYAVRFTCVNGIYAYDSNLTLNRTPKLSVARAILGGAQSGTVLLFVGGKKSGAANCDTVDIYNSSLTAMTPTTLNIPSGNETTVSVSISHGEYALFAGAKDEYRMTSKYIYVFKGSVQMTPIETPKPLSNCAGTSLGEYAVIAGGCQAMLTFPHNESAEVLVYNRDLTLCSAPPLEPGRGFFSAVTLGGKAMFFGGHDGNSAKSEVDVYTIA